MKRWKILFFFVMIDKFATGEILMTQKLYIIIFLLILQFLLIAILKNVGFSLENTVIYSVTSVYGGLAFVFLLIGIFHFSNIQQKFLLVSFFTGFILLLSLVLSIGYYLAKGVGIEPWKGAFALVNIGLIFLLFLPRRIY